MMTAPSADPSLTTSESLVPTKEAIIATDLVVVDNNDKKEKEEVGVPTITTAALIDEASMDIAFISMQQLLDDPASSACAAATTTTATENIACVNSTSVALEPSIVSGTTDLFEGDLGDDELPSIMMSNGAVTTYENLQLNAMDLVEEVQEEVRQEAAADPEAPASMMVVAEEVSENEKKDPLPPAAKPAAEVRRPVVPFAVVRKLSDAQIVGEKFSAPPPADVVVVGGQKRTAAAAATTTSSKKARTTTTTTKSEVTGCITRSRAKRGSPVVADQCQSTSSSSPSKSKKAKQTTKSSAKSKKTTGASPAKSRASSSSATNVAAAAPKQQDVAAAAATLTQKQVVAKNPPPPPPVQQAAAASNSKEVVSSKPVAPTPPPTEPVITDSSSTTGSLSGNDNNESIAELPVVTPVCDEETASAKQLEMASKIESASALPNLPSLTTTKSSSTTTTTKPTTTKVIPTTTTKQSSSNGGAVVVTKEQQPPAKKSSRRSSSSSSKATANKTSTQPLVSIDTSTAHIKALTGENGASVCLSVRTCTLLQNQTTTSNTSTTSKPANTTSSSSASGSGGGTTTSTAPMTEEERAQQSRDRNRKHARNTRLRKKAYVEELKQTLNELVAQRDRALAEQQHNRQRELEQREVRFRVMEEFLKLRGRNERDSNRWSAILAPDFSMTLPQTTFQTMVVPATTTTATTTTTQSCCGGTRAQALTGVEEVMQDSCHFSDFLQSLGKTSTPTTCSSTVAPPSSPISIVYQCDRKDFMMDGCNACLEFNAISIGAVSRGASTELSFGGSMRAYFCDESNRLRSTAMIFDTGTIVDQRDAMLA